MKPAFIVTILASIFLVGIPPFGAYWVKSMMDELKLHLWHHNDMILPIVLLIIISLVYAAVIAKFISLNFIKGDKPEHEHLEGGGLMKLGYGLMVAVLFVLSYAIFKFEETQHFVHAGGESLSIIVGMSILVVFVAAIYKPQIKAFSSNIGVFFNDRMYLPFLNEYIVPKIGFFIAHLVQDYGNRAIDAFFHTKVVPGFFKAISRAIRAIQTGFLTTYVKIAIGFVLLILVLASIGGMGL